jgi:2Fe-2S ferredoxin
MPKVVFTSHDGTTTSVDGSIGDSVMQTGVRNGVDGITAECGGVLSCATCHVFLDEDDRSAFPPVSDAEAAMLQGTAVDCEPNSRLSCQLVLAPDTGEVHVTLPEYQE